MPTTTTSPTTAAEGLAGTPTGSQDGQMRRAGSTTSTTPEPRSKVASVAALVKAECSGYRPGGHVPRDYCHVLDKPCSLLGADAEPCEVFEKALLTIASRAVAEDYAVRFPASQEGVERLQSFAGDWSERQCPRCGGPLPKRKQLCDACRKEARRASFRREKQRQRTAPGGVSYNS